MSVSFTHKWGLVVSPRSKTIFLEGVDDEVFKRLPGHAPFRIRITSSDFAPQAYSQWLQDHGEPAADVQVDAVTFSIREAPVHHDITICKRCGGMHKELRFTLIKGDPIDVNGTKIDRWAICPTTGDPILGRPLGAD